MVVAGPLIPISSLWKWWCPSAKKGWTSDAGSSTSGLCTIICHAPHCLIIASSVTLALQGQGCCSGHLVLSSTKKRSSSSTVAFSLSTLTHRVANMQVCQIQNGVCIFFTSLLSLSFSPIIVVITLCQSSGRDLAWFWRL